MGYPCTYYTQLAKDEDEFAKLEICNGKSLTTTKPIKKYHHRRSGWTWCLYITGITLGLIFLLSTIVGIWGILWTRHQVKRFTVTDPGEPLPVNPLPYEELEVVKDRVKLFGDTLLADKVPEQDLVITQEELNGFIAQSDYFRGHANVKIEQEKLSFDMSLPAKFLPGGKDRYFVANGYVDIDTSKEADSAFVTTHLDTKYKVHDVQGPLWHAEMTFHRQQEEPNQLVLNVERGNFLNWVVPQDFIDEKVNLMDYLLCDDHHHDHDHHHHHHHDDDDHHHHHHHDDDHHHHHHHDDDHHHHHHDHDDHHHHHDGEEDAKKIIESIQSVTLDNKGRISIHAIPASVSPDKEDNNGNPHHRFLRAGAASPSQGAARMLWKLLAN